MGMPKVPVRETVRSGRVIQSLLLRFLLGFFLGFSLIELIYDFSIHLCDLLGHFQILVVWSCRGYLLHLLQQGGRKVFSASTELTFSPGLVEKPLKLGKRHNLLKKKLSMSLLDF